MTTPSPPRATQPGRCGVLVTTDGPLLAAPKGPAPSADVSDAVRQNAFVLIAQMLKVH
jgi:hypothetical protein